MSRWHVALAALALAACSGADDTTASRRAPSPDALSVARRLAARDPGLINRLSTADVWRVAGGAHANELPPGRGRLDALHVRAGETAASPLLISLGGSKRWTVRMTRAAARSVASELHDKALVYPEAYPGVDLLVVARRDVFEELYLLHAASGVQRFAWTLALGPGFSGAQLDALGGLRLVAHDGSTWLRVSRPFALDAGGVRRDAELSWDGRELGVALDTTGLTPPILLDPALETGVWEKVPTAASGVSSATFIGYDPKRNRGVLTSSTDTYEWSGSAWTKVSPATAPPPPYGHGVYHIARSSLFVLSGGTSAETWEYAGTAWQRVTTATTPTAPRGYAPMAYDPVRNSVVYVRDGTTWEYDGTDWRLRVNEQYTMDGFCFDPDRNKIVGVDDVRTWTWDGTSWTIILTDQNLGYPQAGAMIHDPDQHSLLYVPEDQLAGTRATWELEGGAWSLRVASAPGGAFFFHPVRRRPFMLNASEAWEYHSRGNSCAVNGDCMTGHCVDGVCCESASCGTCQKCDGSAPGTCEAVSSAADPDSCSGTTSCDASGACKKVLGEPCASGTECVSGYCRDAVCCDGPCNTSCSACRGDLKASGTDGGRCGPAAAGLDPHDDCSAQSPNTCQLDGACDGAGACRFHGAGTACGPAVCSVNSVIGQVCDGSGVCSESTGTPCAPGLCAAGGCVTTCTTDADCDPSSGHCDGAECATRLDLGQPCARDAECSSRLCVDGVCCNAPCKGLCEYCAESGSEGTCLPVTGVPRGTRGECPVALPDDPCSAATCDGVTRDQCSGHPGTETGCRAASCSGGAQILAATCDGTGSCPPAVGAPCTPYACGATSCLTRCVSDVDCATGYTCITATGECFAGTVCNGDHALVSGSEIVEECAPFRCAGNACLQNCATTGDCVAPAVCSDRECVVPEDAGADEGGCVCEARAARSNVEPWLALVAAAVGVSRARRRRLQ